MQRHERFPWVRAPTSAVLLVTSPLADPGRTLRNAFPFVLLTVLLLALPSLAVLVLGRRTEAVLPMARDWMSENSWIVNEVVVLFFYRAHAEQSPRLVRSIRSEAVTGIERRPDASS